MFLRRAKLLVVRPDHFSRRLPVRMFSAVLRIRQGLILTTSDASLG